VERIEVQLHRRGVHGLDQPQALVARVEEIRLETIERLDAEGDALRLGVRRETLERDYDRIPYEPLEQNILGIGVRKVVIQVEAGRNIAVLVEAAVRNAILQLRGINTYEEFVERHRRAMEQGD
jgi:hypothetical protein